MIREYRIFFVNQPEPLGFGDAVLKTKAFVGNNPFLLYAGDNITLSENNDYIHRLLRVFNDYQADAVILIEEVEHPEHYGVIVGECIEAYSSILRVIDIFENQLNRHQI